MRRGFLLGAGYWALDFPGVRLNPLFQWSNRLQAGDISGFVQNHTRAVSLRDGTRICLRPIAPTDKQNISDGLARLSPESRYRRFMAAMDHLSDERLSYLTEIDYDNHFAWAAFALEEVGEPGIAVARYVRIPKHAHIAEPAVAVIDDYQGRGLGTLLLALLSTTAAEHGITTFRASLLNDNQPMREMLKNAGATFHAEGQGVLTADVELPGRDRARYQLLSAMIRHACEAAIARASSVFSQVLSDKKSGP